MVRDVDVAKYWRSAVGESSEFIEISNSENPEFKIFWNGLERILENGFIDTADDFGLSKWEQFLLVTPYATDTLTDRRLRIKALLMGDLPYTMRSLDLKLTNICGEGNYQINYIKSEFLLQIRLALVSKSLKSAVWKLLKRIVPANIILDLDLLYNRHCDLAEFKHKELRRYTHEELRSSVLSHETEGTNSFGVVGEYLYDGDSVDVREGALNE